MGGEAGFQEVLAKFHRQNFLKYAPRRTDAVTTLKELTFYLISNPSIRVSFNKLKEQFRLGSVNTINSYIDFMENSWLVFTHRL